MSKFFRNMKKRRPTSPKLRMPKIVFASSITSTIQHNWQSFSLFLFVLIMFVSHTLYVQATYQYSEWDEHLFLDYMIRFYDILLRPSWDLPQKLLAVYSDRQPVYPLTLSLPLLFLGTEFAYKTALLINGAYYAITIVGVYFLGRSFLPKTASLLASIIFGCYGFPLFYQHFLYSETAATAFAVLSLVFLARSIDFPGTKNVFLFSLFFALGTLTRWTVPIFVIGPLFLTPITWVKNAKGHQASSRLIKNIALIFLIGCIVPMVLYFIPKSSYFLSYIKSNTINAVSWVSTINYLSPELANPFSVRSMMFYFNILSQQTVLLFFLFVAGFVLSVFHFRKYSFFLLGFILPYCFFTFISIFKDDRFIVPIYPMMALLSAVVYLYVKQGLIKKFLIFTTVLISVGNFFGTSWGMGPMGKQGLKDIVLPEFIHHPRRIYLTPMVWPPRKDQTNVPAFISTIESDFGQGKSPVIVLTFRYHPFDAALCKILCYEKRHLQPPGIYSLRGLGKTDYGSLFSTIARADYLAVKSKDSVEQQFSEPMLRKFNETLLHSPSLIPPAFVLLKTFSIDFDKSSVFLYKKVREVGREDIQTFAQAFVKIFPEDAVSVQEALLAKNY